MNHSKGWFMFNLRDFYNMVLVLVLFSLLLILGLIENYLHQFNLRKLKYRILVNGTRGKTTVSRIIVNALNANGIKTIGRTTGSEACIVLPDNSSEPFKRRREARITEMISFARFCKKNSAECIVVECMALIPENQKIFANKLIRPTHTVITNSYVDHIPEMGSTIESTMWALSNSIYKDTKLFVSENEYADIYSNCCLISDEFKEYDNLPVNRQSINLAYSLLKDFGLAKEEVLIAAESIVKDVGLHDRVTVCSGAEFYPYFSVNDFYSMRNLISTLSSDRKINLIFNNRADREYRICQFEKALYENIDRIDKVYLIGDFPKKVARYCNHYCKANYVCVSTSEMISLIENDCSNSIYLGLGNIKGPGEEIVRYFIKEDK